MSWRNGRSLTAASSGSTGISFTYDAGGMRTSKTVGNVTSIYAYASGKLLREIRYNSADQTTDILDFFYAYDGTPYAMKYNGTVYYFVTNLQGDVMMILDASGSLAGGYVYDPYGKVLTATGTIAQINPIRYRGYYYDTETGFYYLHSRYYDPEIGRFINADGYASTGQGVIGHNMFAYCNNNPINCIDIWGDFPVAATIIIGSGAIVGGISGALSASSTGGNVGTGIFKGILTGTAGAVCGLYSTPIIGLASGTVIDLGTQVISQLAETGELDISQINILAAANTGISTAAGVLVPVWGDAVESIGAALGTSLIFAEASMIITATEIAATNSNIKPKSSNTTKKTTYTPKYPINSVPLKATQDKYKIPSYKTSVGTSYTPEMKKKLTVMERRLAG